MTSFQLEARLKNPAIYYRNSTIRRHSGLMASVPAPRMDSEG